MRFQGFAHARTPRVLHFSAFISTAVFNTTAPTGDEIVTPDDVVQVLQELLPAQNQSYALGLQLKLPRSVVDTLDM